MPIEMAPPVYGNLPQIQGTENPNALTALQVGQQLRLAPGQQQLQQQQIQSQGLGIQEQQMQMASQKALMQAYQQAGGDPTQTAAIASKSGAVLPKDLQAFNAYVLDIAAKRAEIALKGTDVDQKQQAMADDWHDTLHNAYLPAMAEPDPSKQAKMVADANAGLLTHFPGKSAADLVDYKDPDSFKLAMAAYTTDKWTQAQATQTRAGAQQTQAATSQEREKREAGQQDFQNAISGLAASPPANAVEYQQRVGELPYKQAQRIFAAVPPGQYDPQKSVPVLRQLGMSPEQQTQADQAAANAANSTRPRTDMDWIAVKNDPNSTPDQVAQATKNLAASAAQHQADRPVVNVNTALTPEGLDVAALQFAKTGQLPALGMGAAGMRAQIINRAAQLQPNLDLATNAADYQANKGSLVSLQKNRDAIVSFESTASKNLDQFLATAKSIVDSGSPIVNKPLRGISTSLVGSNNMAAFEAARRVAVNEVAKVTSNPNLTGQLSDSARHEVESFIPEEATLGQVYKVAGILRQDMKNRHDSLDDQIGAIQSRIGGRPAANPSGGGQGGGQATAVRVTDSRGVVHTFPDQASANGFKKAAGIQ